MLQVGLDLRPTESGFKAHAGRGTGRYATELVRHLGKLLEMRQELRQRLSLVPIHTPELVSKTWEQRLLAAMPAGKRTLESQFLFPQRVSRLQVDLVHFFSHGDAPARWSVPQVVTVLDLIPLRFPDLYKADKPNWRFKFARFLEYEAIRRARGVLAISECTKQDLIHILKVPEERIIVTHLGVEDRFGEYSPADANTREECKRLLNLPEHRSMLLYVGGIDPRKNILFLVRMFAELLRMNPQEPRPFLALAGRYDSDDQYPKLLAEIKRLHIAEDVRLLGFVPDEQLPVLYRAAELKVFPSLFEGFGFPVLEAMAAGTPVVAGNNSSIPEVTGECALLLEDNNIEMWVRELSQLLASSERRHELAVKGQARAKRFTWEQTASATANAYLRFARAHDTPRETTVHAHSS